MPNPYNEPLIAQLNDLYERAARIKERADLSEQQMRFREWAQDYTKNQDPGAMDRISSIYQRFSPNLFSPGPSSDQIRGLTEGVLGGMQGGPEGAIVALAGETQPRGADFFKGLSPGWPREIPGALLEMAVDPTSLATGGSAGLLKGLVGKGGAALLKGLVGKGGVGLAMAGLPPRLTRKGAREAVEEGAGFFSKKPTGAYDDVFGASAKSRGGYADEGIESFPAGGRAIKEQRAADEAWWKSKAGRPFKNKAWYKKLAAQNNIPGDRLVAPGTPGAEVIQVPIMRRRGGKIVEEGKELFVRPGTKVEVAKARRRMPKKIYPGTQLKSLNQFLARQAGETEDYIPGSVEHALRSAELYPDKSHAELYERYLRHPTIQKSFPEFRHFRPAAKSSAIERLNAGEIEIPETQLGNAIKFAAGLPGFLAKTGRDELFNFMSNSARTGQRKLEDRLLSSIKPREKPSVADQIIHRLVQEPRKQIYNALEQRHSQASIPPRGTPQYLALARANAEGRLPEDYFGRKDIAPWQKNLYLALRDTPTTEIPTLASAAAIGIGGPAAVVYHAAETGPQEAYDPVSNKWEDLPEGYSGEQGRVYRDPEEVYNVGMETREDPREQYSLAGAMLKRIGEGLGGSWELSPDDDPRVRAKKLRDRISRLEAQIKLLDMAGQDTTELQEKLRRMIMPEQKWMPAEQAEEVYNQAVDRGYLQSLQEIQDIEQRGYEPEYSPGWIKYVPYANDALTLYRAMGGPPPLPQEPQPLPLPQEPQPELFRPDAVNPRTELPYPWVPGDNPYL